MQKPKKLVADGSKFRHHIYGRSSCGAGAFRDKMKRDEAKKETLAEALSPLAQEELEHFDQVLALLQRRGIALRPLPAPAYGSRLAGEIRRQEPLRQLDSFLVAGLIEARSHERMALLAEHSPDPELQALYGDLLASEARHFGLYWLLCEQHWPREVIIPRLEQLAAVEVEALNGELARPEDVRMHSVGVQLPRENLDPVAFTPT